MPDNPHDGQILSGWTLVFDLDGTLVETAPDLLAALNHVLEGEGLAPVSLADIRTMIGQGAKAMIRKGLAANGVTADDGRIDALWQVFLAHYRDHIADNSAPFDGVPELLPRLRAAGARLAVCTNKTQALSERLLGTLDLTRHFDALAGADSVPRKKPDGDHIRHAILAAGGEPDRAIMIGDSRTDERAALDAGLPFLFVTFGYEPEDPARIAAAAAINTYSELFPAIRDIISGA